MDPELWRTLEEADPSDEIAIIVRRRNAEAELPGIEIVADFGEIVTARARADAVRELRAHPDVESVKAADELLPEPDDDVEVEVEVASDFEEAAAVRVDVRRPEGLRETGRGVCLAVIDWGCDFAHPDFVKSEGGTRIHAIWDQRGGRRPGSPTPYGYGVVHTRQAIDRALATADPYAALGYHPADADSGSGAHGTHCLGIAAGNGRAGGPSGVAPEAEPLIFVHLAATRGAGLTNLGDSVTLLEAVDFVRRTAGDRPFVISLSVGNHGGPHDGLTLVEQALDAAVARPGAAVCQSTGNYYDKPIHAAGQLRPGTSRRLAWMTSAADTTENELEVWYPGVDVFEVEVHAPDGTRSRRIGLGEREQIRIGGQLACSIYHRAHDPNNLKNHINIFIHNGAPAGTWRVEIHGVDVADGRYHCWVERDGASRVSQSLLDPSDAVASSTTGTICNGYRTIAVGAYNAHSERRELAPFSSAGPTADGRPKPDIVAPGVDVLAARSAPRSGATPSTLLTRKSGSSMAAPHVAGTVALMLQASGRRLAVHETRAALLRSARSPARVEREVAVRMGDGYLDVEAAVAAARRLAAAPARTPPRPATARSLVGVAARTESDAEPGELDIDGAPIEGEVATESEAASSDEEEVHSDTNGGGSDTAELEQIWGRLLHLEEAASAFEGFEDLVDVQEPQGIEFEDDVGVATVGAEEYAPPGGRRFTASADPAIFRCAPTPVAVAPATALPQASTAAADVVRDALRRAGVEAAALERFERAGGVEAISPIAAVFGAAFAELVGRIRYSPAMLVAPPHTYRGDAEAARRLGVRSRAFFLAPRLLLAIPGHFRELARRAPTAGEAFALENLGWLIAAAMRGQVSTSTGADWWLPPLPPWVTPFSSTLPAFSTDVQQLILRTHLIDTTLAYGEFNARFAAWANGPAGRLWQLEIGQDPNVPAGRPFVAVVAPPVASVNVAAERAQINQAWQQRLAQADARFGPNDSDEKTASLRTCDDALLRPLNLMQAASLGGLRLVYDWPARRNDRLISRLNVLRPLVPAFERVFNTVYELGWNDLLFQTSGAGCFRGIKHPPGATFHSAARRLSDHGYGIAIDVNVPENPHVRRRAGADLHASMDPRIVALFEASRFRWGHCFRTTSDAHHFEYCGGAC